MKAFPYTGAGTDGMDLRDFFAAHALQSIGIPTKFNSANNWEIDTSDSYAKLAYQIADAMMKARDGGEDE